MAKNGPIIFANARVFDGEALLPIDGAHIAVEDGRIREISDRPIGLSNARLIECAGKTLMPGLIDAHYHAYGTSLNLAEAGAVPLSLHALQARALLEATLQRGFTTVRDAGGADIGLALATERGLIHGPRIFYAGRPLTQTGGHGDMRGPFEADPCSCGVIGTHLSRIVDGADAMRLAVREELRRGAHQIKLFVTGGISSPSDPVWMRQFSDEEVIVAVEEAATRRTYVMAHAYTADSILRGVRCGVRSFEHGNLIDRAAAEAVKVAGAFVVPTLVTYEANHLHGAEAGAPAFMMAKLEDVRSASLSALALLEEVGVQIGFGTDLLGPLHLHQSDEFEIRARVMKPIDILRSATSVNARLLMREGELGVVKPGALADLILVDGDPIADLGLLGGQGEHIPIIVKGGEVMKDARA